MEAMKVKVAKWGNSLGVRLPKAAVEAVGVAPGTELELVVDGGGFRLRTPTKTSRELLKEMIAEMKRLGPGNEPETVDWGPDRGAEVIDDAYSQGAIGLDKYEKAAVNPTKAAKRSRHGKQHAPSRRRRHRVG
jgi:antitoxin MazE